MEININNEYDKLRSVIVASANYFDPNTLVLNNETIKHYAFNNYRIDKQLILFEQKHNFWCASILDLKLTHTQFFPNYLLFT